MQHPLTPDSDIFDEVTDLATMDSETTTADDPPPLPERFARIKQKLIAGHEAAIVDSWYRLLRRLREEDPHKWDVRALSEKYSIPHIFVMMCCQAPKEKLEFERKKMELIRQRWGPIRAKAKEDRHRRTQMLYRGEI